MGVTPPPRLTPGEGYLRSQTVETVPEKKDEASCVGHKRFVGFRKRGSSMVTHR